VVKLSQILDSEGIPVRVHCFLDGRDTPPRAGKASLNYFLKEIKNLNDCKISSMSGRYWAMDRDSNWDRVAPVYDAIVSAKGKIEDNLIDSVSSYYKEKITDEFITPTISRGYSGMEDGDGLFMANFRADRARQILTALVGKTFTGFIRSKICNFSSCLGMVEYSSELNKYFEAIFPAPELKANLGQVISEAEGSQLRIAETEKYAHVTYFFSGGREEPNSGEQRILVKSPNG
jgi:Phosphoglyceromutase